MNKEKVGKSWTEREKKMTEEKKGKSRGKWNN